jgi:pyruvate formate-lyase activating enzyme-like uncharacterized protein
MFDTYKSFTTVIPEKSTVHFCTECYNDRVIVPAQNMYSRKNNEKKYQEKIRELAYAFKKSLYTSNSLDINGLIP